MKVLLLHGWPVSERVWVSQVSALREAGFDPVVPHLYGRGPSIDDWAAHLLRETDGPLVVVGASMGGYCALALARRAPERILGMVLVGTTCRRRHVRAPPLPPAGDHGAPIRGPAAPRRRGREPRAPRGRAGGDARSAGSLGRRRRRSAARSSSASATATSSSRSRRRNSSRRPRSTGSSRCSRAPGTSSRSTSRTSSTPSSSTS